MGHFKLSSAFKPSGDQPQAIDKLVAGIQAKKKHQVLLGVTGSGKTFTMANVIEKVNKPTLVIAHNKTLAAQLCSEFREFFPDNAVEYFISYYDFYQPEAYIPARDAYIEKEAQINENIERLRHSATRSLLSRNDTIIVASVSCIYGLGMPEDYMRGAINLKIGAEIPRRDLLLSLTQGQYERNDLELLRGRYRIKGDTMDIHPAWDENILRIEFFGDEIDRMTMLHPVTGNILETLDSFLLFPATHYVVNDRLDRAMADIKKELIERITFFESEGKAFEANRIKQRTNFDLEMMVELGYCKGIENYSRHISGRQPGESPGVLMDFFPDDYLLIIDESHVTIPQIRGMYAGDRSRKDTLVKYGFRLPSAIDNRPLNFDEFEHKLHTCVHVSATPGPYELDQVRMSADQNSAMYEQYELVEQLIRPTGLVDPEIHMRPSKHQIDDLLSEIHARIQKDERVLVTTLTKRMSEDLTAYLEKQGIKVGYLHSDIKALERIDILHHLRTGKFDVLVGVNLLREGLDLPEVSLVAILDADKSGFLRNERSLIQTMGRAARNANGKVILYGDVKTDAIKAAVAETRRRRDIQMAYNKSHGIVPQTIRKKITDIRDEDRKEIEKLDKERRTIPAEELPTVVAKLTKDMETAAKNLEFELAAVLRDQIDALNQELGPI